MKSTATQNRKTTGTKCTKTNTYSTGARNVSQKHNWRCESGLNKQEKSTFFLFLKMTN